MDAAGVASLALALALVAFGYSIRTYRQVREAAKPWDQARKSQSRAPHPNGGDTK